MVLLGFAMLCLVIEVMGLPKEMDLHCLELLD